MEANNNTDINNEALKLINRKGKVIITINFLDNEESVLSKTFTNASEAVEFYIYWAYHKIRYVDFFIDIN